MATMRERFIQTLNFQPATPPFVRNFGAWEETQMLWREVDRVMPLVEDGGYLPELDHTAPPDISWQNYGDYMRYLLYRLGRG